MDFNDGILKGHNNQPYLDIVKDIEEYGKACAIHATGTGKMYLALKWLNDNKKEPFAFCAPSLTILNKFADLILETYFEAGYLSLKNETIEDKLDIIRTVLNNENINLITYSKLNFMEDEEMLNIKVKNIVLDEFHHLGADKWGSSTERFLKLHKDKSVLGLSATPIRPSDKINMVEELFDGRISSTISLEEAVGEILPYPTMIYGVYSFKEQIAELEERLDNKLLSEEVKLTVRKKIKEARRIIDKADGMQEVFDIVFSKYNIEKGKFIVFCSSIEDMYSKMEACRNWFKEGTNVKITCVSSDENYSENGKAISSFEKEKFDGVNLLFSVNMLNEGLHVDDLDGVIMLRPTSSNIVFLQQLGRALAVSDINKRPLVFDLVNNVNVMRKDMEQFRQVFSNGGFGEEKEKEKIEFTLQTQVIDIVDYLESVYRNYTSRRIRDEIFLEYCKDPSHPTLEHIKVSEKFSYQGKIVNIGNMLEILRAQYKLRDSKVEQIGKITRPLSDEEVQFFESLKIKWKSDCVTDFDKKIEIFKEYLKSENISMQDVKGRVIYEGYQLGTWIAQFRKKYKNGTLTDYEKERLNEIGFAFEVEGLLSFEEKVEVLKEFCKEQHKTLKDIVGIEEYKGFHIGRWIDYFRKKYRVKDLDDTSRKYILPLSEEEKETLEKLGMVWEKDNTTSFEEKIRILKRYCLEKNTDISIVKRNEVYDGYKIGDWLSVFRQKNNEGTLEENQEKELDKLGMLWDASREVPIDKKIELIIAYSKEANKEIPEISYGDKYQGYPVGAWIGIYRAKYRARINVQNKIEGRKIPLLTDEEYEKLKNLKIFETSKSKMYVERKLAFLEKYCKDNNVSLADVTNATVYQGETIGAWIALFRRDKKNNKLSQEIIEKLESLGMIWDKKYLKKKNNKF